MKKLFLGIVILTLVFSCVFTASAVQYAAFDVSLDDTEFMESVQYNGREYALINEGTYFGPEVYMTSGCSGSDYKFYVPGTEISSDTRLGLTIIEPKMQDAVIMVFEGDRNTGKYALVSTQIPDGKFVDAVYPSVNEAGEIAATDKIYLFEYYEGEKLVKTEGMLLYITYNDIEEAKMFSEENLPTLVITPNAPEFDEEAIWMAETAQAEAAELKKQLAETETLLAKAIAEAKSAEETAAKLIAEADQEAKTAAEAKEAAKALANEAMAEADALRAELNASVKAAEEAKAELEALRAEAKAKAEAEAAAKAAEEAARAEAEAKAKAEAEAAAKAAEEAAKKEFVPDPDAPAATGDMISSFFGGIAQDAFQDFISGYSKN